MVIVVIVGAVSAGLLLRDRSSVAGVVRIDPIGDKAPPRQAEPGPATVTLVEDVAVHPDAGRIRTVLQRYFDAINAGDYRLWTGAVIPQWARDTGENAWRSEYRSALDGSIVVHRLEPRAGGGLLALTSFTRVQDPADAPPELPVRCLRWWVSFPLIGEGDQLRMGPPSSSANVLAAC